MQREEARGKEGPEGSRYKFRGEEGRNIARLLLLFLRNARDREEAGDHIAKKVGFIAIIGRASGPDSVRGREIEREEGRS